MVGDHLYVSRNDRGCASHLVSVAEKEDCAISAVSAIRENTMPNYGVIGGKRVKGSTDLYTIDTVVEKPTPTEAEQKLLVPGLRSGHYLCFFGMHVLTPSIFKILETHLQKLFKDEKLNLSFSLNELSKHEKYLALKKQDWRYDVGTKYGLLKAQVALALSGKDRDQVRDKLRLKHYSYRTEQSYVNWIKRFIFFHNKRHPDVMGEKEIEMFLTHLIENGSSLFINNNPLNFR